MLTDFYGNHLTTSTGLARDNYDIGLRAFLSANYGAQEAFSQAVEADPNFSVEAVLTEEEELQIYDPKARRGRGGWRRKGRHLPEAHPGGRQLLQRYRPADQVLLLLDEDRMLHSAGSGRGPRVPARRRRPRVGAVHVLLRRASRGAH